MSGYKSRVGGSRMKMTYGVRLSIAMALLALSVAGANLAFWAIDPSLGATITVLTALASLVWLTILSVYILIPTVVNWVVNGEFEWVNDW